MINNNLDKWKCCYNKVLNSKDFKNEAKYTYLQEVAIQAEHAWRFVPTQKPTKVCNINQAYSLLFDSVSPTLIASGRMDELVDLAFTMFYAPCLKCNSKWLREGRHVYFKNKGVKAVLSAKKIDHSENSTGVHSVLKQFKKFGTASAHTTLKRKQAPQ